MYRSKLPDSGQYLIVRLGNYIEVKGNYMRLMGGGGSWERGQWVTALNKGKGFYWREGNSFIKFGFGRLKLFNFYSTITLCCESRAGSYFEEWVIQLSHSPKSTNGSKGRSFMKMYYGKSESRTLTTTSCVVKHCMFIWEETSPSRENEAGGQDEFEVDPYVNNNNMTK